MAMALAVAMVACSGAAGTPGPAGPKGDPGEPAPTTPTTPTDPTTPTEPAGPPNAAPVAKMIPNVYLALEGTGKMLSAPVDLGMYITDADSVLRFGVNSSDEMVATVKEKDGMLTITAMKAGPAMITVTANDGTNPALEAKIAVTVVTTNAAPSTNGLSGSDRKKLEMPLYIAEGPKPFTVTIISSPGAAPGFDDAIVDKYMVVVGDKAKTTDDYVTVTVKNGTGNNHVINVEPKAGTNGKSVDVKIYPMDKFGAMPSAAWKFKATINTIPKVLTGSFSKELMRDAAVIDSDESSLPINAVVIEIAKYFQLDSLQRMVDPANTDSDLDVNSDTDNDQVGDTVCSMSYTPTSLAIVMSLNDSASGVSSGVEYSKAHYATGNQAIEAILIDSRVTSYGADMEYSGDDTVAAKNADTLAKGEGTVTVTIRCGDKDASAVVTGTVVVRS